MRLRNRYNLKDGRWSSELPDASPADWKVVQVATKYKRSDNVEFAFFDEDENDWYREDPDNRTIVSLRLTRVNPR